MYQFLAVRIYSVSVNSMADERTASNFTWFNSGLRNRQNVGTLTRMIQIRQWALHMVRFFVHIKGGLDNVFRLISKMRRPSHRSGR